MDGEMDQPTVDVRCQVESLSMCLDDEGYMAEARCLIGGMLMGIGRGIPLDTEKKAIRDCARALEKIGFDFQECVDYLTEKKNGPNYQVIIWK